MEKKRMQKLAGINEGTAFKNGKFELQRYHGSTVSSGNWCQSKEVAELEQLASEMYAILDDITGEAAFEGLPESKQDAIYAIMDKAKSL